jgi:hypothetical protein
LVPLPWISNGSRVRAASATAATIWSSVVMT